jgi:hypothetical protein
MASEYCSIQFMISTDGFCPARDVGRMPPAEDGSPSSVAAVSVLSTQWIAVKSSRSIASAGARTQVAVGSLSGCEAVAKALGNLTALSSLDLSQNALTDGNGAALCKCVSTLVCLRRLRLVSKL